MNERTKADLRREIDAIREALGFLTQGDYGRPISGEGPLFDYLRSLQLDLRTLKSRSEALQNIIMELQSQVDQRDVTVEALQESEIQLKYLANHDSLTGALNRRSFMERAAIELTRNNSRGMASSVAMMDIDFFKRFNDSYGHLAGDEALRNVVKAALGSLRREDFMGRYGGEEFVFFFSGAPLSTAYNITERIRETILGNPVEVESGKRTISASFGVAGYEPGGEMSGDGETPSINRLINYADKALYRAKRTGRNRTVNYDHAAFIEDEIWGRVL